MQQLQNLELPVADDYVPSEGELDNLVYLTYKYTCGWPMRRTDLQVCLMMARSEGEIEGNTGLTRLCMVTCEYLWDHICSEPEEISPEAFFAHIKPALQQWYGASTPEDRAKTE